MNLLVDNVNGPLWLKRKPRNAGAGKGDTMDEQNYVRPSQEHVECVLEHMQKQWAERAKKWWDQMKESGLGKECYDDAMLDLVLRPRTFLQLESILCEAGNRQLRARAYAAAGGKGVRGTKCRWDHNKPRKGVDGISLLYLGESGDVIVTKMKVK